MHVRYLENVFESWHLHQTGLFSSAAVIKQSKSTELCSSAAVVQQRKSYEIWSSVEAFHHELRYLWHQKKEQLNSMIWIRKNL